MDIFQNLHQKHGKAVGILLNYCLIFTHAQAVQKALTKFSEGGQIVEKTNGKQKFYYVKQEDASAANQAELDTLDQAR